MMAAPQRELQHVFGTGTTRNLKLVPPTTASRYAERGVISDEYSNTSAQPKPSRREQMAEATRRVAEQARNANAYMEQNAYMEESVADQSFEYPLDIVVTDRKIHSIRKRS